MRLTRPLDAQVAPDERIGVLLADAVSAPGFRSGRRLQRVSEGDDARRWRHPLLVLSAASTLPGVAHVAAGANRQHRLRGLLIRRDVGTGLLGPMLDRAGLLAGRHILVHEGPPLPRRVLDAWEKGAENELIAEASVTGGMLFVLSCALERLDVPVRKLAALSRLSAEELRGVTVSPDGSYLHWPRGDVHLDLGSLRYLVDPVWRARADLTRIRQHARFGDGVRAVREAKGLTQRALAGVSARHLRRIEGGASPKLSTLRVLASAHGMELDAYLSAIAEAAGGLNPRFEGVRGFSHDSLDGRLDRRAVDAAGERESVALSTNPKFMEIIERSRASAREKGTVPLAEVRKRLAPGRKPARRGKRQR